MIKGIDISHYQGSIDFAKVKADGIGIVIIKATEGRTYKDSYFKTNYANAKANGLLVGAYHFLRGNAAEDEVDNFLSVVSGLEFDCKLIIDAEVDLGGVDVTSRQIRQFADILKANGKDIALYTGEYFYNNNMNDSVKDIPLWVAKYSSNKPNVSKEYIGWQYTSDGRVSGICTRVDMNEFSEDILIKDLVPNNPSSPQPAVKKTWENYINGDLVLKLQHELNVQFNAGIKEDSYLGDHTLEALKRVLIKRGAKGKITKIIQERLLQLGYKLPKYGADSDFGAETENTLRQFQGDRGLNTDAIAGINTFKDLFKK